MRKTHSVLIVINDAGFFISHRWPLALAARDAGYHVEIAAAPDTKLDWIASQGFPVHPVPFDRKGLNPLQELRTIFRLWRLYVSLEPDLVHHITIKPIIYGGIIARMLRLPAVVHAVTGLGHIFAKAGLWAHLMQHVTRMGYRTALHYRNAYTIFQNPDDRIDLMGAEIFPRTQIIRGAGVEPDDFNDTPEPDGKVIVAMASRMLWSKGVGEFVEAARRLRDEGCACRMVLVGDSDPGNPVSVPECQLQAWHKDEVIEWWGYREDMPAVLSSVHIMVLPTKYREGVPKVLIEAASSSRAIICTDMPGCREIVKNHHNGILVPPNNIDALVEAIKKLANDPVLRSNMGKRGRQMVLDEFSLQFVLDSTLSLYSRLLTRKMSSNSNYCRKVG